MILYKRVSDGVLVDASSLDPNDHYKVCDKEGNEIADIGKFEYKKEEKETVIKKVVKKVVRKSKKKDA